MKMSCILQGLKDKGYINFKKYRPPIHLKVFETYKVESLVGKKFENELKHSLAENDEYIICNNGNAIIIAKKEDIDYWTSEILFEEIVFVKFGYPISRQLAKYIENKDYTLYPACYETGAYKIINNKVQNERLKKEQETEEKAINFLKCLQ